MNGEAQLPKTVLIVAIPETAGSALYGMVDVLAAAGNLWDELVGLTAGKRLLAPKIVSPTAGSFICGNGIPVNPDFGLDEAPMAPIIILPELWLSPTEDLAGRYPALMAWIRERYDGGASIYSACTGAIMLAETGLLDGREATSHWGYDQVFRVRYPKVRFQPAPNLCFAERSGRLVTAGGTSSWQDLALHIIAKHCGPAEAMRIAKVYLLKWHSEGDMPFASLVRRTPHADAVVRRCEAWLEEHYKEPEPVGRVVAMAGIPERTAKRRFKAATGSTLIDRVQNLRLEEAKRLLETSATPFDEIAADVGYENTGFFRRLFKRRTGLTPAAYRRMFQAYEVLAD